MGGEGGGIGAAGDPADGAIVAQNRHPGTERRTAPGSDQSHASPWQALLALGELATDALQTGEGGPIRVRHQAILGHQPAQRGLHGRRLGIKILAVETQPRLQSEDVAGSQTCPP